jgi:vacuolar protein sorting-associated protein 54
MKMLTCIRILADAEYFDSRISKLDGAGDLGGHIVNVVRAKAIISEAGAAKQPLIEKPQEEEASRAPPPLPAPAGSTETT